MKPTTWLTTTEAAEVLAMHPETVRKLVRRGDLEAKRTPGGRYKVATQTLTNYMNQMENAA